MNKSSHKKATLICMDEASALETIALRGALEYFGFVVSTHWIGNKKQFLGLMRGQEPIDDIAVIVAHGDEGIFHLPTEETVSFAELKVKLPDKIVISTGCGTIGAAEEFLKGKCCAYICPRGFPEGNDATFFTTKFFWLLARGETTENAFDGAAKGMPAGSEFVLNR